MQKLLLCVFCDDMGFRNQKVGINRHVDFRVQMRPCPEMEEDLLLEGNCVGIFAEQHLAVSTGDSLESAATGPAECSSNLLLNYI